MPETDRELVIYENGYLKNVLSKSTILLCAIRIKKNLFIVRLIHLLAGNEPVRWKEGLIANCFECFIQPFLVRRCEIKQQNKKGKIEHHPFKSYPICSSDYLIL